MKRFLPYARVAWLILLLAALLLGTTSPTLQRASAATERCGSWQVVPSPPLPPIGGLYGVAASSHSDAWAVGAGVISTTTGSPLNSGIIEHWNGTQWSIVPAARRVPAVTQLTGVTAVSSTDVWAVGYAINNHYALLSEHWNGSQWSIVQAAPPGGPLDMGFTSITATDASHAWAVGNLDDSSIVIENWNGHSWHLMQSPPNPQFAFFNGIAAASADNVWAVGGLNLTSTIHFDGTKWSMVPSLNGPYSENILSGVAILSDQSVWAVGSSGDSSIDVYATLIEQYC